MTLSLAARASKSHQNSYSVIHSNYLLNGCEWLGVMIKNFEFSKPYTIYIRRLSGVLGHFRLIFDSVFTVGYSGSKWTIWIAWKMVTSAFDFDPGNATRRNYFTYQKFQLLVVVVRILMVKLLSAGNHLVRRLPVPETCMASGRYLF